VDDKVHLAALQLDFQLLGEEALLADLGQGDVEPLVSDRGACQDLKGQVGKGLLQLSDDMVGLDEGELEGTTANLAVPHGRGPFPTHLTLPGADTNDSLLGAHS
jgi:hypothetical protein